MEDLGKHMGYAIFMQDGLYGAIKSGSGKLIVPVYKSIEEVKEAITRKVNNN